MPVTVPTTRQTFDVADGSRLKLFAGGEQGYRGAVYLRCILGPIGVRCVPKGTPAPASITVDDALTILYPGDERELRYSDSRSDIYVQGLDGAEIKGLAEEVVN